MSKLLEKLERISEGRAQPLGFSAAASRAKSLPMLVIASVPAGNAGLAALAVEENVDALLLTIEQRKKEKEALAHISRPEVDIPWGISLHTATQEELDRLVEMNCDYVIFSPDKTPAAVLSEERIGKVLQADLSLSESMARSIARLSVDAVLLSPHGDDGAPLTVHQLMVCEQVAGRVGKRLLAVMPPGLPLEDLESLWGLGVRGLVVDITAEHPKERLSRVREALQKIRTTKKKAGDKVSAVLPIPSDQPSSTSPDDDDDDI